MARRREWLAELLRVSGRSQHALAREVGVHHNTPGRWVRGIQNIYGRHRPKLADALGITLEELDQEEAAYQDELGAQDSDADISSRLPLPPDASDGPWTHVTVPDLDGIEAVELIRRVEASDTGTATLDALGHGVDRLCRAYTHTPPGELLQSARTYQGYLNRILDGRATLGQRRRLLDYAGWLSLLVATTYVDLGHVRAAAANLNAARTIAGEIGDDELSGWVAETKGWQALTNGNYDQAAQLCEAGLQVAPADTSAQVQLLIQHARASANLGDAPTTYRRIEQATGAMDRMPEPAHPEHHFVFDPRRLVAYSAAALAWLADDDTLAEEYARQAVAQYAVDPERWVHRLALARIDLGMVLARTGQPAEATHQGTLALSSWRVVQSDAWHIERLRSNLATYRGLPPVDDFHERCAEVHRQLATGRDAAADDLT